MERPAVTWDSNFCHGVTTFLVFLYLLSSLFARSIRNIPRES